MSSTGLRVGGSELVSEFEGRGNASDGSSLGGDLSPERINKVGFLKTDSYKSYYIKLSIKYVAHSKYYCLIQSITPHVHKV